MHQQVVLRETHDGETHRAVHLVLHAGHHAQWAVRRGQQQAQTGRRARLIQRHRQSSRGGRRFDRLHGEGERRLDGAELCTQRSRDAGQRLRELGSPLAGHRHTSVALTRDRVDHRSAAEGAQAQLVTELCLLGGGAQQLRHELDGVAAATVDVHTGVAALQTAHLEIQAGEGAIGCIGCPGHRQADVGFEPAGAAHADGVLFLAVQVDEQVGLEEGCLAKTLRPAHGGLFVHGEEALERTVFRVGITQQCKHRRTANAIVGAQRCTSRFQPLTVDPAVDRILVKIENSVIVRRAHHVQMSLECHGRCRLTPFAGRLFDHNVAFGIGCTLKRPLFGQLLQSSAHRIQFVRRSRDFREKQKVGPHIRRTVEFREQLAVHRASEISSCSCGGSRVRHCSLCFDEVRSGQGRLW
mmetsp:Transcript_3934/g.12006  ORF Transcript_3934/g.12006 Transcript_3934/m.12006 type:complete len:411 (-) Transcript_3934:2-1234(-)